MDAIRQGIVTSLTKAALQKAERERDRIYAELKVHSSKSDNLALTLPNLRERFEKLIASLASLKNQLVDKARAILKNLLGPQIVLYPSADGSERGDGDPLRSSRKVLDLHHTRDWI